MWESPRLSGRGGHEESSKIRAIVESSAEAAQDTITPRRPPRGRILNDAVAACLRRALGRGAGASAAALQAERVHAQAQAVGAHAQAAGGVLDGAVGGVEGAPHGGRVQLAGLA